MRRLLTLAVLGCVAVTLAAPQLCAQSYGAHEDHGQGARPVRNSAPVPDQFVSAPGQMVSTPGQMVTGPGQMVTAPGQMVIPPGQAVIPMGQSIAPTPGVIAPFVTPSHSSGNEGQPTESGQQGSGFSPGRREHHRHEYRPEYGSGAGYAVPYFYDSGYGAEPSVRGSARSSSASGRSMKAERPSPQTRDFAAMRRPSLASAPSGNRPAYRGEGRAESSLPASAPNVIQSREPVLTIVMKNGSRRKVRNYALTPQALMDLDGAASGYEVNIPLSEINLPATEKAAAQAGLSFAVPTQ